MRDSPALVAFDEECSALAEVLRTLLPDDFDRMTNCPPWNLHELVVHIAASIRLPDELRVPAEHLALGTAADYFRRAERGSVEYRSSNVERTRAIASTVQRDDLVRLFIDIWKKSSATFAAAKPTDRIERAGRAFTIAAFLLTRLMSVAAHGVDVAITLERPSWTTSSALAALRPLLVDLLESEPPAGWSDQYFLEIGTGRRTLSEADREDLGDAAERFPLLS